MDDSNRRGRRTRKALRDFTLMPSICSTANSEENKLKIIHVEVSILRGQVVVLPYHNNGKVENVPGVSKIGVRVGYEAIRYDLHTAFTGENYRKNYFYFFLQS